MIIVRMMGGLGNQMAQYAFGSIVAKRLCADLFLDTSWYSTKSEVDAPRKFLLGYFNKHLKFASTFQVKQMNLLYGYPFYLLPNSVKSIFHSFSKSYCFKEDVFSVSQFHKLKRSCKYYFNGYWFNLSYYRGQERFVRNLFRFSNPALNTKLIADKIGLSSSSISLHIRRGDYVTNSKANAVHGVLPISYYVRALQYFNSQINHPRYFVFSDDLDWARKNLPRDNEYFFVEHNDPDYEDIRLMSLCSHHIIANSTFSWWGSWLNSKKHKIVIAPKKWNTNDASAQLFLPESWIQL